MKIERILYPTDFSATAKQALTQALFLAESFEAELHMLHAVVLHEYDPEEPSHHFPEPADIFSRLFEIADSEMAELIKDRDARGLKPRLDDIPCIESAHPSPLSAHSGFFGSRPFSRANTLLGQAGAEPVDWRLP